MRCGGQFWLTALSKRWVAERCLTQSSWFCYVVNLCWEKKNSRMTACNVKQTTGLDLDECKLWRFKLLTSPEVRSSGKSLVDSQSGCKTAPCNDAQGFWHKHNDQLWVYSVETYSDVNRQFCEWAWTIEQSFSGSRLYLIIILYLVVQRAALPILHCMFLPFSLCV